MPFHPRLALQIGALLWLAAPAAAEVVSLTSGKVAVFFDAPGRRRDALQVQFFGDDALANVADPRCPRASSLRFVSEAGDSGGIALPCQNWVHRGDGYQYQEIDPSGSQRWISFGGRHLLIVIRRQGAAIPPPIGFSEVHLRVGGTDYCGRFTDVVRSDARLTWARGSTQSCEPPPLSFVIINLDDTRADGIDRMPVVQQRLGANGFVFENAFTPAAICCPSRASLLTGRYAFHHGTRGITGLIGGAHSFRESGADRETIAVWLREAGYRTGLFGKYLNAYSEETEQGLGPGGGLYVPPGWDRWWALVSPEHYGGAHGLPYVVVEEDGMLRPETAYLTDLSAEALREFVTDAVEEGRPFFAYWTPFASHVEGTVQFLLPPAPAARHLDVFASLEPWRPASWNEPDVSDKPRWLRTRGGGSAAFTDLVRRRAYESLLSVDEQVGALLDHLARLGVAADTLVLLTSDNGVGWGEHRLFSQRKRCPYEECQRVPLVLLHPRATAAPARWTEPVLNIDLAPTLAELAGVEIPANVDGASFASWLQGRPPDAWRTDYLIEQWRDLRADFVQISGQPLDGDRLRLFHGDPRAKPRDSVIYEFDTGDGVAPDAVAVRIALDLDGTLANLELAVALSLAHVRTERSPSSLFVFDDSGLHLGVYWWEEVDRGGVLEPRNALPDYFGVRDVANGFTWVEYETGERELYDLALDPLQLENRADDPTYREVRERLEARLDELLE